mmetsp:Transcript_13063/g.37654  ORF Transcript_13063/g.37654 Transcript_13063/m.37654 type:complete len:342 (-) Transcript_13063:475-1500(-)
MKRCAHPFTRPGRSQSVYNRQIVVDLGRVRVEHGTATGNHALVHGPLILLADGEVHVAPDLIPEDALEQKGVCGLHVDQPEHREHRLGRRRATLQDKLVRGLESVELEDINLVVEKLVLFGQHERDRKGPGGVGVDGPMVQQDVPLRHTRGKVEANILSGLDISQSLDGQRLLAAKEPRLDVQRHVYRLPPRVTDPLDARHQAERHIAALFPVHRLVTAAPHEARSSRKCTLASWELACINRTRLDQRLVRLRVKLPIARHRVGNLRPIEHCHLVSAPQNGRLQRLHVPRHQQPRCCGIPPHQRQRQHNPWVHILYSGIDCAPGILGQHSLLGEPHTLRHA